MRRLLPILAVLGLLASVWGFTRSLPRLGEGGPGFLAKEIAGVLGWALVGALSAGYLWLSLRSRKS